MSNISAQDDAKYSCRPDNEWTRENLKIFLTHQDWTDGRQETGTQGISASQLQVLSNNNNEDKSVCSDLTAEFMDTINETWPDGSNAYNVTFYKAGSFYFVSIAIAQPDDPNKAAVGLSFITIYDSNLNRIKGYSF